MQIAKMFASLGFNIDLGDLNAFEAKLLGARREMANFARFANRSSAAVRKLTKDMKALDAAFDVKKITAAREKMQTSFNTYAKNIDKNSNVLMRFSTQANTTVFDINRLADVTTRGDYAWLSYASAVSNASAQLALVKAQISGVRSVSPVGGIGATTAGGARQGAGRPSTSGANVAQNVGMLGGIKSFLAPLTPTGIVGGGALGAGYLLKQIVDAGREYQSLELKIKSVSRSTMEFKDNLAFVNKTSNELALDVKDVGDAYASIFMSAREFKSPPEIQKMVVGFSKFFKSMQLSPEAVKGSFLAIQQMFNKQKITAEEFTGQLGERATGVTQLMAKTLNITTAELFKRMQNGKLTTDMLFKLSDAMGKVADEGGGLAEALNTSASAQVRFLNAWKKFSAQILKMGLDKALASILNAMSSFLEVLVPIFKGLAHIVKGLVEFVKFIWEAVSASKALTAELLFLVGMLITVRSPIFAVMLGIRGMAGAMALATTAARVLGVALKFAGIGVILFALSELMELMKGNASWLEVAALTMEGWMLSLEGWVLDIRLWADEVGIMFDHLAVSMGKLVFPNMPKWLEKVIDGSTTGLSYVNPLTGGLAGKMFSSSSMSPSETVATTVANKPEAIPVDLKITMPDGSTTTARVKAGVVNDVNLNRFAQSAQGLAV